MIDPFEEFLQLNQAFRDFGVEYALCGGMALAAHGFLRATEDIDVLVKAEDLPRIRSIAAGLGYLLSGPPLEFKSGTKLVRLIKTFAEDQQAYLVLDLILVNDRNRHYWESRRNLKLSTFTVTVISKDSLIAMKRESGRPIDLMDIQRLEDGPDELGLAP